jgi:hypothetical protein
VQRLCHTAALGLLSFTSGIIGNASGGARLVTRVLCFQINENHHFFGKSQFLEEFQKPWLLRQQFLLLQRVEQWCICDTHLQGYGMRFAL